MKLPKWVKLIVGFFTFLPFVVIIVAFVTAVIGIIIEAASEEPLNIFLYLSYLQYVMPVFAGYTVFYLTIGLFYLVHIILNQHLDTEKRLLWIAVLFFLNALCLPFYWYLHIWKEPADPEVINETSYRTKL